MSLTRSLSGSERAALQAEIRQHLPAFLRRDAVQQHDPAGDVRALLDLKGADLDRVVAVHCCLDEAVLAFGDALETGLRHPLASTAATSTYSQSVRGPIDWMGTVRRRALSPGETSGFVVREPGKVFDTPENRALVWLLGRLEFAVNRAAAWTPEPPREEPGELRWSERIDRLRAQLAAARRVSWLTQIASAKPAAAVIRSLQSGRIGFHAECLAPALAAVLRLDEPSPQTLADVLSERYFEPAADGLLFEVAVALRLVRAFQASSGRPRRSRLLIGEGRSSFARYEFDDGAEVVLAYQAWPDEDQPLRRAVGERHRLGSGRARPDLIVLRRGPNPDAAIFELKASYRQRYLRDGLEELLAYLADRPDLWHAQPAGWLVAPGSAAFEDAEADSSIPLWVVSADKVAAAAVERFASKPAGHGG